MITVSYELAQRMKELGWEHETGFQYIRLEGDKKPFLIYPINIDSYGNAISILCFAPTADEIAEALKDIPYVFLDRSVHDGVWYAAEGGKAYMCKSPTIAEALGELWCKIQEGE